MNPFKANDFVTIKGCAEDDPNQSGRVDKVEGDDVFISNTNMPFCGSYCGKRFHYTRLVAPPLPQCDGRRRYGGAFTLGPPRWEQCTNAATVLLTLEQDGETLTDSPACATCWAESRQTGLKQIDAKPII